MRFLVFALASFSVLAQDLTVEKQQKLGDEIAGEIEAKTTPIASGFVQDYLGRLGARLAAQMNTPFAYSFLPVIDETGEMPSRSPFRADTFSFPPR